MAVTGSIHHQHAVRICQSRGERPAELAGIGRSAMHHHDHRTSIALSQYMHIRAIDLDQLAGRGMGLIDALGIERAVHARPETAQDQESNNNGQHSQTGRPSRSRRIRLMPRLAEGKSG